MKIIIKFRFHQFKVFQKHLNLSHRITVPIHPENLNIRKKEEPLLDEIRPPRYGMPQIIPATRRSCPQSASSRIVDGAQNRPPPPRDALIWRLKFLKFSAAHPESRSLPFPPQGQSKHQRVYYGALRARSFLLGPRSQKVTAAAAHGQSGFFFSLLVSGAGNLSLDSIQRKITFGSARSGPWRGPNRPNEKKGCLLCVLPGKGSSPIPGKVVTGGHRCSFVFFYIFILILELLKACHNRRDGVLNRSGTVFVDFLPVLVWSIWRILWFVCLYDRSK